MNENKLNSINDFSSSNYFSYGNIFCNHNFNSIKIFEKKDTYYYFHPTHYSILKVYAIINVIVLMINSTYKMIQLHIYNFL